MRNDAVIFEMMHMTLSLAGRRAKEAATTIPSPTSFLATVRDILLCRRGGLLHIQQ
jgi:hypothetical protein